MNRETNWWMVIAIAAVVLLIFSGFGRFGWCGGSSYGSYGMMSWMFGSGWGFMGGFMLVFWILIILFVVWLVKQMQHNGGHSGRRN